MRHRLLLLAGAGVLLAAAAVVAQAAPAPGSAPVNGSTHEFLGLDAAWTSPVGGDPPLGPALLDDNNDGNDNAIGDDGGDDPADPNQGAVQSVVSAVLRESTITLYPTEVDAGTVIFQVTNDGVIVHALAIEGLNVSTDALTPGETETLTVVLARGSYTLYSPVSDDRRRGMEARLVVR